MQETKKTNGMAIAGFVCSTAGVFIPVTLILGIIFSAIGLSKINKQSDVYKGKGLAIAGIVIGIADVLFLIGYLALFYFNLDLL